MKHISPNMREGIGAYDSILEEFFYVEGTSSNGAINVNLAGSVSEIDTNLTQIGGANVTLGQKTTSNSFPVVIASDQSPIETLEQTGLVPFEYDYLAAAYPDADTEVYTYYTGGSGGTLIATITVNYTDATKEFISNVART
jgi:hypothetical protein